MKSLRGWMQSLQAKTRTKALAPRIDIESTIADALASAGLTQKLPRVNRGELSKNWLGRFKNKDPIQSPAQPTSADMSGRFIWCSLQDEHSVLDYKLFLPSCYAASSEPMPLVVMLHGCTQDPDDFSIGTRMNELAEQHAFVAAYPQQPVGANSSKCWNWFRPQDQTRDDGEPKRIARMTKEILSTYRIDPRRVFVAGMSAGGAMAVIMGRTYPEIYAAVAVHSGLPYRCANNVVSALSVMKNPGAAQSDRDFRKSDTPTIVFHGDRDSTVDQGNGLEIVNQAVANWSGVLSTGECVSANEKGRAYTRKTYRDARGKDVIEEWSIHGGGHLWSGGNARGTHTDALGPSASEHFIRFFNAHKKDA